VKDYWKLGLTGGIGSGKSTVAGLMAARGAQVIDADVISRQTTAAHGVAIEPIAQTFGPQVIDAQGALDRVAMRDLIYQNPQARAHLEAIIHPLVRSQIDAQVNAAVQAGVRILVLDIPLLTEGISHWKGHFDRIVVVDCPAQTQIARVMARSGLAAEEIERIISAQATREQRRAIADHIIDNGSDVSLDSLTKQVNHLIDSLSGL
jgi:dephospho-CoA kinase